MPKRDADPAITASHSLLHRLWRAPAPHGRALLSLLLVSSTLFFVFDRSSAGAIGQALAGIKPLNVALAVAALMLSALIAVARVRLIARDLGYHMRWREAAATLTYGVLGGAVFFQIAGQIIARAAYLSQRGVPMGANVIMVGYERVLALLVSLVLAVIGGWYTFGHLALDLAHGGDALVKLIVGITGAIACGALFGWGRPALTAAVGLATPTNAWRVSRIAALTIATQVLTLCAYVALASSLSEIPLLTLAAASTVVMLSASLPISMAGWGVRELSAVVILGSIGMSVESAFLLAAFVGTVSLLVIVGLAVVAVSAPCRAITSATATPSTIDYGALVCIAVPLMTATFVFFQVWLPVDGRHLNVNLADPFALLGAGLLVLYCLSSRQWPSWRLSRLNLHVVAATLVLSLSLLIGVSRFGWTDWALVNKYAGWFVLLAYSVTGALIVRAWPQNGFRALLLTFVGAGAAVAALELALIFFDFAIAPLSNDFIAGRAVGFAGNPNAFAFQLIMVMIAAFAVFRTAYIPATLALVALWYSASRTGLVAVVVLGLGVMAARRTLTPALTAALSGAVGLAAGTFLLYHYVGWTSASTLKRVLSSGLDGSHIQTAWDAVGMFLAYPIFGAGLGAYLHDQPAETALVIHSTPLWLLAETGLVGFLAFALPATRILQTNLLQTRTDDASFVLVLAIVCLAVMSLVHELLYQRSFWLLLGAALACARTPEDEVRQAVPERRRRWRRPQRRG